MLTNSFYTYLRDCMLFGGGKTSLGTSKVSSTTYQTYVYGPVAAMMHDMHNLTGTGIHDIWGVEFGSDNTPATVNDTSLKRSINSPNPLQIVLPSTIFVSNNTNELSFTGTYCLGAKENLVIGEMGLTLLVCTSWQAGSPVYSHYFIDRTVFDEPIELAIGEHKEFSYNISFMR